MYIIPYNLHNCHSYVQFISERKDSFKMGKMEGSIPRWHREITSLPRVQAGLRAQVGSPLRGTWPEPSGGSLPASVCSWRPSSAMGLHTQVAQGESKPPRSSERPESIDITTPAALRNLPRTPRTQEPRGNLGQESSNFHLHRKLILGHRATYTNTAARELVS